MIAGQRKRPASLWPACKPNQATKVKIPDVMRAKGYSYAKAADQILIQQVRRNARKVKGGDESQPESAAALLLLALATVATTARPALQMILTNQTVAPVITVGGIDASILPSPERKVRKTSHQEQISNQNKSNHKAIHAQAHARATNLVAKERTMPKEDRQTTAQVIAQVHGEFSV